MLHRLCGPPSIPLSFNLAAVLPRRCAYRVSYDTEAARPPNIQRTSFTAWTTRVSNPVCSPRFRASASVLDQVAAFATGVLPNIYEFHLYTGNSTTLFRHSRPPVSNAAPRLSPGISRPTVSNPPTRPLRPVIPSNASPLRITAAAGTKLAGASSAGTVIIVPAERTLQSENLLHPRGIAGSGLRPLSNIPHCCLP